MVIWLMLLRSTSLRRPHTSPPTTLHPRQLRSNPYTSQPHPNDRRSRESIPAVRPHLSGHYFAEPVRFHSHPCFQQTENLFQQPHSQEPQRYSPRPAPPGGKPSAPATPDAASAGSQMKPTTTKH